MTRPERFGPLVLVVALTAACGNSNEPATADTAPAITRPADTTPSTPKPLTGSGGRLAKSMSAVIKANGATPSKASCDSYPAHNYEGRLVGNKGDIVDCKVTITGPDGTSYRTGIRLTWDDDHGHFSTQEQAI
jgi:hypothetical protein